MESKILGVPLVVWGGLCLALAVVWGIVWPSDRAGPVGAPRYIILRWFHALVWLLLALAAFCAAFDVLGGAAARVAAAIALIAYLVFILTLTTSR